MQTSRQYINPGVSLLEKAQAPVYTLSNVERNYRRIVANMIYFVAEMFVHPG